MFHALMKIRHTRIACSVPWTKWRTPANWRNDYRSMVIYGCTKPHDSQILPKGDSTKKTTNMFPSHGFDSRKHRLDSLINKTANHVLCPVFAWVSRHLFHAPGRRDARTEAPKWPATWPGQGPDGGHLLFHADLWYKTLLDRDHSITPFGGNQTREIYGNFHALFGLVI